MALPLTAQDDGDDDSSPFRLFRGKDTNAQARIEAERQQEAARLAQAEAEQRKTKVLLRAHESLLTKRR